MLVNGTTVLIFLLSCGGLFLLLNRLLAGAPDSTGESAMVHEQAPGPLSQLLAASIPQLPREKSGIAKELKQAGRHGRHAITRYLAIRNGMLLGVCLLAIGAVVGALGNSNAISKVLILSLFTFVVVYALPRLYLQNQASRRVARIEAGLPDALDMMTMCVTAGLPLRDAMGSVCREIRPSHPDVSRELAIINAQAEAGSIGQALNQFAERIDAPDIRSLASIVGQTDRLGTNVATAISDYADNVRRTQRRRAEERANKLSFKMLFPVVLCLAPPVYIVLIGPPILQLADFITRTDNRAGAAIIPPLDQIPTDTP